MEPKNFPVDWGCGWWPPGWYGHHQAWETSNQAWDKKANAAFEAYEIALVQYPWESAKLTARLDNHAAEHNDGLNQGVALQQGDIREAIATAQIQAQEINKLAVLDFMSRGQKVDAQMAAGYNEVLLTQAWVRDDTVETALAQNVQAMQMATAALKDILGRSVANPAVLT
jgi:hypothetical protein